MLTCMYLCTACMSRTIMFSHLACWLRLKLIAVVRWCRSPRLIVVILALPKRLMANWASEGRVITCSQLGTPDWQKCSRSNVSIPAQPSVFLGSLTGYQHAWTLLEVGGSVAEFFLYWEHWWGDLELCTTSPSSSSCESPNVLVILVTKEGYFLLRGDRV